MKRKQSKPDTAKALRTIQSAHIPLYALEELTAALEMGGVTTLTANMAGAALADQIRGLFSQAMELGADVRLLGSANRALDDMKTLGFIADHAEEIAGKNSRALGSAMRACVAEAGRWMEQAQAALGEEGPFCGWIQNAYGVKGFPTK